MLILKFLKFCINNRIIPQHLYYLCSHNIKFTHSGTMRKYKRLTVTHSYKILRMELNDAFRTIHRARAGLFHLVRKISSCIPDNVCNTFFDKQKHGLYRFQLNERDRLKNKMEGLLVKQKNDLITQIKKINYYYHVTPNINHNNNKNTSKSFSLKPILKVLVIN